MVLPQQLWNRPDVSATAPVQSTISSESYFNFETTGEKGKDSASNVQEARQTEMANLSHIINIAIKPWLDFGKHKQVPSLKNYVFSIIQKNSIPTIIKDFHGHLNGKPSQVPNISTDMNIHFLMHSANSYYEFDLQSDCNIEESHHLMILLRNDALWNAKHLHADAENSFTKHFLRAKNEKSRLLFPPVFSSYPKSGNDSCTNLNLSDSKPPEEWQKCLAPRQKFLLLYIEDRYITLYLYNWNSSFSSTIVGLFANLITWHNSRSLLLQSLILQKAGIFHHVPFKRHSFEDILQMSKVNVKDMNLPQFLNMQSSFGKDIGNVNIFKNTDLLLKFTNPLDAIKELNKNTNKEAQQSRCDSVFDSKNYAFIFSNFEPNSGSNLFDAFNGQFNSNYNLYIKGG